MDSRTHVILLTEIKVEFEIEVAFTKCRLRGPPKRERARPVDGGFELGDLVR